MTRNFIVIAFIAVTLASCNTPGKKKSSSQNSAVPAYAVLEKSGWLLGTWENFSDEGTATESWKKENDSTFTAESFIIAEEDTVFYENVILQLKKDTLDYVVSTKTKMRLRLASGWYIMMTRPWFLKIRNTTFPPK